ncbi:uncharacterized protein [Palaemon carinicauda]|uniref:uncharacterized protein n=1 Tax=Palaemon carinicauda TaxID=392227 RepID=UPI0035B58B09
MNVKRVLYEKWSILAVIYGSELWGIKVTERQKLNAFEMKFPKSMVGVSLLDRGRNEVVKVRSGMRNVLAVRVDIYVLRWFGHVKNMGNCHLVKKVMNARVDGRSARGHPRVVVDYLVTSLTGDRWIVVRVLLKLDSFYSVCNLTIFEK